MLELRWLSRHAVLNESPALKAFRQRPNGIAVIGLLLVLVASTMPARAADIGHASNRDSIDSRFQDHLNSLATKCDELGLADSAATTRQWIIHRDPNRQYLFPPATIDSTEPSADASLLVRQWHRKFSEHRSAYGQELFGLAEENAQAGLGAASYQLLHEVLRQDPTHAKARHVLGLKSSAVGSRIRRQAVTRRHPIFGWEPRSYWKIESEHYDITTNSSLEAGVELASQLEDFHGIWRQVFFDYWSSADSLMERFAGGSAPLARPRRLQVVLFRDQAEYVRQLEKYEPQIAMSLGYYMKGEQTAFFYAGDDSVVPTWYHEAAHQLFQELGNAVPDVGERSGFWAVEGIAVYMESLAKHEGYFTLGGFEADRLQFARARALSGEFMMPFSELSALGREPLQTHEEIRRIYTQAAGLAHFFMDAVEGTHRQAFVQFITLLYLGRAGSSTLPSLVGKTADELDGEYIRYLNVSDDDLRRLDPSTLPKNMALGRTSVTDDGLRGVSDWTNLEWLDLSFTMVTDRGLAGLSQARKLVRLNLEGTRVSAAALPILAELTQLQELDLSRLPIDDTSLAHLAKLAKLNVLWLGSTNITDAGLSSLESLSELQYVDVSGTAVTPAALRALADKLPKLTLPSDLTQ